MKKWTTSYNQRKNKRREKKDKRRDPDDFDFYSLSIQKTFRFIFGGEVKKINVKTFLNLWII